MQGDFDFPTRVVFGPGRLGELSSLVRGWGQRALIVTDRGVLRNGVAQPVLDALAGGDLDYHIYGEVDPNPTEANIDDGVRHYREGCEFIVAVGGGSALDAAKAIRLLATHEGPLAQYAVQQGGDALIRADLPPMLAIPTTAGTGSEVGRSTVITMAGRKTVIFSPHLMPTIALCDPLLTLDLPVAVTAGTGADALTHNVEAYFALGFQPLCDAIALDGMARAMRALPTAVHDGQNVEARSEMMLAALMGAVAFQKGLGVVHSLSHPLTTVGGVHHGTANAIMLPHALRFNSPAITARAGAVAAALGVPAAAVPAETVERIASALDRLFQTIGLPTHLHQVNISSSLVGPMSELAIQDACHLCNPRPVTREDMAAMYTAAL